jgi:hypothetical protein
MILSLPRGVELKTLGATEAFITTRLPALRINSVKVREVFMIGKNFLLFETGSIIIGHSQLSANQVLSVCVLLTLSQKQSHLEFKFCLKNKSIYSI